MLWVLTLVRTANLCLPAWHQPSYYTSNNYDSLTQATAWCYPTAAASLLGYLANKNNHYSYYLHSSKTWRSNAPTHYPELQTYVEGQSSPWGDYMWHEQAKLNLGSYTKTNKEGKGTTLANGKKGIEDFVKTIDPSVRAIVTDHTGLPKSNAEFPLLLHIKNSCINPALIDDTGAGKLADQFVDDNSNGYSFLNNNPSNLDHTVVTYGQTFVSDSQNEGIERKFIVAMNVPTYVNNNGTTCALDELLLQKSSPHNDCITGHTTVKLVKHEDDDNSLTTLAIVVIAVGATAAVALIGYIAYKRRTKYTKVETTTFK